MAQGALGEAWQAPEIWLGNVGTILLRLCPISAQGDAALLTVFFVRVS